MDLATRLSLKGVLATNLYFRRKMNAKIDMFGNKQYSKWKFSRKPHDVKLNKINKGRQIKESSTFLKLL